MKKKIPLILVAMSLFGSATLLSAEPLLTLKDALNAALRDNPELLAARKKWEAARTRVRQDATPDKPRLEFEWMYAPRENNPISDALEKNIAVSQDVPFPTVLYLKGKKASQEARAAEALYRAKERDVVARIKTAYAMYAQSFHHARIVRENAELMKRYAKIAESKYAIGKTSQADVLKAQVELARMLNMQVDMEQEIELSRGMLNVLLNRKTQDFLGLPSPSKPVQLTQDLEELQSEAIRLRPELQEAEWKAKAARSGVALARSEYLPDFMLQYRRRNMDMGTNSHDAMLGLSVPLWFWKQDAMVDMAQADRDMNRAELESMKNMTLFDVQNRFSKFQTAVRQVQLYDTSVLPQAKQALRVTETAYQADKADFLDLLEASRTLATFHFDYIHYLTESDVALADLERVVGTELNPTLREDSHEQH